MKGLWPRRACVAAGPAVLGGVARLGASWRVERWPGLGGAGSAPNGLPVLARARWHPGFPAVALPPMVARLLAGSGDIAEFHQLCGIGL
jgi:hypothetical protein